MDGGRLVVVWEGDSWGGWEIGVVTSIKNSVALSLSLSLRQPLPLPRPRPLQILAELSVLCAQCTVWGGEFLFWPFLQEPVFVHTSAVGRKGLHLCVLRRVRTIIVQNAAGRLSECWTRSVKTAGAQ